MAIRKIRKDPDPILRKISRRVDVFDWRLWQLLDDMADTLRDSDGVGLAAVQVGILRRIVIVDTGKEILELINPEIISSSGLNPGVFIFVRLFVTTPCFASRVIRLEIAVYIPLIINSPLNREKTYFLNFIV